MTACTVSTCGLPAHSKGLCSGHYARQRRGAEIATPLHRSYAAQGILCAEPDCDKLATSRDLCGAHYQVQHGRAHGIPRSAIKEMLYAQGGVCASCEEPVTHGRAQAGLDHDHSCCPGKFGCPNCVRAILCAKCNTALGMLDENVEKMRKLIAYTERWAA